MGSGKWSAVSYSSISQTKGYTTARSVDQIFTQKTIDSKMNPYGVEVRESRDSVDNPNSVAIMIWLDQTGSMGRIPFEFVKNGMPVMMSGILGAGIQDPHLFFGAIGDHTTGEPSPLQVGQFEASAELIDRWLSATHMVGQGGGNNMESYLLAWYFAGYRTSIDCLEKRGIKGCLFTIGDEKTHPVLTSNELKAIMGPGQYPQAYSAEELLAKAQEKYNVYHLHVNEGSYRNNDSVLGQWRSLLGENLIVVEDYTKIPEIIANICAKTYVTDDMGQIVSDNESVSVDVIQDML